MEGLEVVGPHHHTLGSQHIPRPGKNTQWKIYTGNIMFHVQLLLPTNIMLNKNRSRTMSC